jgi:hypothetical protein
VAERLEDRRPSRTGALFVATAAGLGTAVLVYRLRRAGGEDEEG